jgi:hypothetical protein
MQPQQPQPYLSTVFHCSATAVIPDEDGQPVEIVRVGTLGERLGFVVDDISERAERLEAVVREYDSGGLGVFLLDDSFLCFLLHQCGAQDGRGEGNGF